jgi:hypothetical protein
MAVPVSSRRRSPYAAKRRASLPLTRLSDNPRNYGLPPCRLVARCRRERRSRVPFRSREHRSWPGE